MSENCSDFLTEQVKIAGVWSQLRFIGFQFGKVEYIIDQTEQGIAGQINGLQKIFRFWKPPDW